jgi:hypothetical protein
MRARKLPALSRFVRTGGGSAGRQLKSLGSEAPTLFNRGPAFVSSCHKPNNLVTKCLEAKTPGKLPGVVGKSLATKAEALDQLSVALDVYVLQVAEQTTTLTDKEKQATT